MDNFTGGAAILQSVTRYFRSSGIQHAWQWARTAKRWRKRVGVEPTGDGIARRPPVLKTGTITGPHALPRRDEKNSAPGFATDGPNRRSLRRVANSRPRDLFPQLFRLGNDGQIRLGRLPSAGILFLCLLIRYAAADDDILARLPVRRGGNFVLRRELDRIDDPENFVEIPAGGHGIAELQLYFFVVADD